MKYCLITPPSPFLLDERVFPHLGILKIAAILRNAGHEVDVLDLSNIENYLEVIKGYNFSGTIVGITATTPQIPYAIEIVSKIDDCYTHVLGGPHVSLMNSAAKKGVQRAIDNIEDLLYYFDYLVCGDGEKAILNIPWSSNKIIDADENRTLFLTNEEFTNLPFPARDLIDLESYQYTIEGHKATSLIAQLGCPFGCTFCGGRNSPFLRKIRVRSTDSIIEELRFLHTTYGYTGFMFYDDELNVNKFLVPLMKQIKDLQVELKTEFRLRGFVKAELFNDEQAEAMYEAGFRWLLTGFESGDDRILVNIEKKATREDNTRCINIARKHGLKVKALMSIGHAGESLESIKNTKDWLLEVKPDDFDCTIITVYPGSPYYDEAIQNPSGPYYTYTQKRTGDKLHQKPLEFMDHAGYYKGDPNGGYTSYVWTDYLSPEQLVEQRDLLEREIREKLNIPFNPSKAAIRYEHSMGQGLPSNILRGTK